MQSSRNALEKALVTDQPRQGSGAPPGAAKDKDSP